MATILNQANLTYTYGTTTETVASNIAETEWNAALAAEKRVLEDAYREGSTLTYLISLTNDAAAPVENLVITDNLGAFTPAGAAAPVVPLTFAGNATLFIDGVFSEELTPTPVPEGIRFTIPSVPANANALLIYQATANAYAPLAVGSEITNTATVGETEPLTVSATVPVAEYADVSIEKEMRPNPITDGDTLTAIFTIENRGNTAATGLVLTDDFPVSLSNVAVTVNGAPVTDFTFDGNSLTLPASGATTLSVPKATFSVDATGAVSVTPGVLTIVLTGTI
ncbi:MAG: DUF11 domain-containing protein [Clostridia bacterium]|nr:DUF11 domain-containing protein [Clostridia bacterium]